jgi:hypothetical protein
LRQLNLKTISMRKIVICSMLILSVVQLFGQPAKKNIIPSSTSFNGYTNYWHDEYKNVYRYGNLFKMAHPDVEKTISQSKLNVAEDLQLNGLDMQEGFISHLLQKKYDVAWYPSAAEIQTGSFRKNLLVVLDPLSKEARGLHYTTNWRQQLNSHQLGAANFSNINAFIAKRNNIKTAFIITSDSAQARRMIELIGRAKTQLQTYKLYKGWFGAETLLKSVTCVQGHPLEIIGRGLNEGNSFFTFNGYMDFLMQQELDTWIKRTELPIVVDVGFAPMYGLKNYDGLQVQDMPGKKAWVDFAHSKGGYAFQPVYEPETDSLNLHYDGYIATEGNKEQIDAENKPFIVTTGSTESGLINSMLLFVEKENAFTKETMWKAILAKHSVAVLDQAKMMGSDQFRNTVALLYLDREYLENYFGDKLDIQTRVTGYSLEVTITNYAAQAVSGELLIHAAEALKVVPGMPTTLQLAPFQQKIITINLQPAATAMGQTNPVAVTFHWGEKRKSTVAMLDLPPAISVHRLLFGHAPEITYPVTIHNFSTQKSFPVKLEVFSNIDLAKPIYTTNVNCTTPTATFKKMNYTLPLDAGHYQVKVSCLGVEYTSQLGVESATGLVKIREEDINKDGIPEYIMENEQVKITLLSTGARVIEYYVKNRQDNILFKLWPEKAEDDRRPFRKRGYYPYGGFEDFLGQGSMETHKVYKASVIKKEGDFVQVRMVADYFGNEIEKTFTLYGNTPLLEIRFALTFKNPEANVLGPQPILELGKVHGPEDIFTAPTVTGIEQYRMRMNDYYGRMIQLKEGWNAGYDTVQDISFVGAYPVDQPLFLHMWMNHPRNGDAHYYYTEFQPWTPIVQKTTMYFSYYMWGAGGPWEDAVKALRERNLITIKK